MKLELRGGLLYTSARLTFRGREVDHDRVIVDTGSASTLFAADAVTAVDLFPEPLDTLRRIRGVGGVEFVFTKKIDRISVGELQVAGFEVEIGALEYGFAIEGILGLDFLRAAKAVLDLAELELRARR